MCQNLDASVYLLHLSTFCYFIFKSTSISLNFFFFAHEIAHSLARLVSCLSVSRSTVLSITWKTKGSAWKKKSDIFVGISKPSWLHPYFYFSLEKGPKPPSINFKIDIHYREKVSTTGFIMFFRQ